MDDAFGRLVRRASPVEDADEHCELCDAPLPSEHRHVLDLHADELRCACRACALLFEREAAGRGFFRLVPQRRVRLDDGVDDTQVAGIPVGLAFFVVHADGSVLARYPSPMGATDWEPDPVAWQQVLARWPLVSSLAADVEALLIYTAHGNAARWIVPVDDCYRLVAVVRTHWTGLSGGRDVWPAVDRFFAGLNESTPHRVATGTG